MSSSEPKLILFVLLNKEKILINLNHVIKIEQQTDRTSCITLVDGSEIFNIQESIENIQKRLFNKYLLID